MEDAPSERWRQDAALAYAARMWMRLSYDERLRSTYSANPLMNVRLVLKCFGVSA